MTRVFSKRSFNFTTLATDLVQLMRRRKSIRTAMHALDPTFIEHIMLACTAVNGCRYCAWGHAVASIKLGEHMNCIESILNKNFDEISEYERPALDFAVHYSEMRGKYSQSAFRQLRKIYGNMSDDILTVIMMINFGNLAGNTIDAFEARMHNVKPKEGSLLLEFNFYLLGGFIFKKIMEKHPLYQDLRERKLV